jgi:hypothetical protein
MGDVIVQQIHKYVDGVTERPIATCGETEIEGNGGEGRRKKKKSI